MICTDEIIRAQQAREIYFYVGIDTHTDTHTIAVLTSSGRTELTATYPATRQGYTDVVAMLGKFGDVGQISVGIEGTNSYGAGLSRVLREAGFAVREVLRPTRQVRRMDGKSDPIDAIEAARTLMSGRGISIPKDACGPAESLRYLMAARNKYISIMTALSNSLLSLLITAPQRIRERYTKASTKKTLASLSACRFHHLDTDSVEYSVLSTLKSMAQTHMIIGKNADDIEQKMHTILLNHYPALLAVHGVGTITASALAVVAGDNPRRIHSEAALAKLCGACPIPASSGKTNRYRLNRGGNRDGNQALHRIALVRMSKDDTTKAYVERQLHRGKTKKDILRQLKRALCREIYRELTNPAIVPVTNTHNLRELRIAKGITEPQAARALNTWPARISDIETGRRPLTSLRTKYEQWLSSA